MTTVPDPKRSLYGGSSSKHFAHANACKTVEPYETACVLPTL